MNFWSAEGFWSGGKFKRKDLTVANSGNHKVQNVDFDQQVK